MKFDNEEALSYLAVNTVGNCSLNRLLVDWLVKNTLERLRHKQIARLFKAI